MLTNEEVLRRFRSRVHDSNKQPIELVISGEFHVGALLSVYMDAYGPLEGPIYAYYAVNQWVSSNEDRLAHYKNMEYKQYLRSKAWRIKREIIIIFYGKCLVCGKSVAGHSSFSKFHIHHNTYENKPLEEFIDLILLCSACHHHAHRRPDYEVWSQAVTINNYVAENIGGIPVIDHVPKLHEL